MRTSTRLLNAVTANNSAILHDSVTYRKGQHVVEELNTHFYALFFFVSGSYGMAKIKSLILSP